MAVLGVGSTGLVVGVGSPIVLDEETADPAAVTNAGQLYTKDVASVSELFYEDSAGAVTQLSAAGTGIHVVNDAVTDAVTSVVIWRHTTTGTAANGIGAAGTIQVENAAGTNVNAGRIDAVLTDVTDASEDSVIDLNVLVAGTLTRAARFGLTGNQTTFEAAQVYFQNGTAAAPSIAFEADTDLGIYRLAADTMAFMIGSGLEAFQVGAIVTVNNGGSASVSFQVSGDTISNMIATNSSADTVGLGSAASTSSGTRLLIDYVTATVTTNASDQAISITGRLTEAGSGTHAKMSAVEIAGLVLTNGGGATTTAVTCDILSAPATAGANVMVNSYALQVGADNVTIGTPSASTIYSTINVPAHTLTLTGTTQVTTATSAFSALALGIVTATNSSSETIDNSATLYISGSPAPAGSVVMTNRYALWVDAGKVRIDGAGTSTQVTAEGGVIGIPANTVNGNNASSTIAIGTPINIPVVTYTNDTATLTMTNVASLYIAGVPVASTNVTFTNTAYAFWVDAGNVRTDEQILASLGSASAPPYAFHSSGTADADTGMYSPGADQVGIATAGTARLTVDATGDVVIQQGASTSGSPIGLQVVGGSHTTLAAGSESQSVQLDFSQTVQHATGGVTTQRAFVFYPPTYSFVGASTITNLVGLDLQPVNAGTNCTVTTTSQVRVASGGSALGPTSAGMTYSAFNIVDHTNTVTGTTQVTSSGFTDLYLGVITISGASAVTINNASSLYINGSPVGGGAGPATITNSYAIWVDSGKVRFDGGGTSTQVTAEGGVIGIPANTVNGNNASSTIAIGCAVNIPVVTYTNDTATLTMTNAASLYIAGVPVASTNVTFTNAAYSIWIDAGLPRIDSVTANGAATVTISNLAPAAVTTATIAEWLTISINGTTRYIPVWGA